MQSELGTRSSYRVPFDTRPHVAACRSQLRVPVRARICHADEPRCYYGAGSSAPMGDW
jgi:hypothetical protein